MYTIILILFLIIFISIVYINTNKTASRLYDLAIRMDYKPATYQVRQTSNTPRSYTGDTFQNYKLTRVTYRPATQAELLLVNATLNDLIVVWTIYTYDLGLSKAPVPQVSYLLIIESQTWMINKATNTDLNQSWDCICTLSQGPTAPPE